MATVRVHHTIGDLASDMAAIVPKPRVEGAKVVKRNVTAGNKLAQRFARGSSGPHGENYWKRITSEMTGALEGEYGPHGDVVENAVGAGWRGGPQNTDLPRSADIIGPQFEADVHAMVGRWFW